MEETSVEKRVCKECGVDVRPDTAFCYNCGRSVTETPDKPAVEEVSSAWFGETITSDNDANDDIEEAVIEEPEPAETVSEEQAEDVAIPAPDASLEQLDEKDPISTDDKPATEGLDPIHHSLPVESGLKSAASIRKKPKTFRNKEVEVVWEEHGGRSNLAYLLITLVVVLFTLVVFYFAMQMK